MIIIECQWHHIAAYLAHSLQKWIFSSMSAKFCIRHRYPQLSVFICLRNHRFANKVRWWARTQILWIDEELFDLVLSIFAWLISLLPHHVLWKWSIRRQDVRTSILGQGWCLEAGSVRRSIIVKFNLVLANLGDRITRILDALVLYGISILFIWAESDVDFIWILWWGSLVLVLKDKCWLSCFVLLVCKQRWLLSRSWWLIFRCAYKFLLNFRRDTVEKLAQATVAWGASRVTRPVIMEVA